MNRSPSAPLGPPVSLRSPEDDEGEWAVRCQADGGGLDAWVMGEELLGRGGAEALAGAEEEEVGQGCAQKVTCSFMAKPKLSSMSSQAPTLPDNFLLGEETVCSHSLATCLDTYREIVHGFLFLVSLAARADAAQVAVKKALNVLKPEEYEEPNENEKAAQVYMRRFRRSSSQNLVNNSVNAFQRYFSQLTQECIRRQPAILTSNEQVPVMEIISFTRMKDVIELLVERRVNKLSYEGIDGIEDYLRDRMGLVMFSSDLERRLAREMIELRNINVHNGGVVNAIFLSRIGDNSSGKFTLGSSYHVDWDEFTEYASSMWTVMTRLDAAASKKFRIRRKKFRLWTDGYHTA